MPLAATNLTPEQLALYEQGIDPSATGVRRFIGAQQSLQRLVSQGVAPRGSRVSYVTPPTVGARVAQGLAVAGTVAIGAAVAAPALRGAARGIGKVARGAANTVGRLSRPRTRTVFDPVSGLPIAEIPEPLSGADDTVEDPTVREVPADQYGGPAPAGRASFPLPLLIGAALVLFLLIRRS